MSAGRFELLVGLKFRAAGADHVEPAGIAVRVDDRVGQLHVLVLHKPVRPLQEPVELVRLVQRLEPVVKARDDVVPARGLPAGENHADVDRLGRRAAARLEGQDRAAEGGLENRPDLFDVGHRGGRSAFVDFHIRAPGQRGGEFRGVGGARLLQRRDAHGNLPVC